MEMNSNLIFSCLLYASIVTAFTYDKTIFGVSGNTAQFLLSLSVLALAVDILIGNSITKIAAAVKKDRLVSLIFVSGLLLIVWQLLSNTMNGWTVDAVKQQSYWVLGFGVATVLLAARKISGLGMLRPAYVLSALCLGQAVNMTAAGIQLASPLHPNGTNSHLTGTLWYPQLFGVTCAVTLPLLWLYIEKFARNHFFKIVIYLLAAFSAFCIPGSGSRDGTLCFALFAVFGFALIRSKSFRIFLCITLMSLAFGLFGIPLFSKGQYTSASTRSIKAINTSTQARYVLYQCDRFNIMRNPVWGIGMDIEKYRNHTRNTPFFAAFQKLDPWVAASLIPHSEVSALAVQSGIPGVVFYYVFFTGILIFLARCATVKTGPLPALAFLLAYGVFNIGLVFHTLSFFFQWMLLAAALAVSGQYYGDVPTSCKGLCRAFFLDLFATGLDTILSVKRSFIRSQEKGIESITVLGFIGIGDWMVAMPTVAALAAKYPNAKVRVITDTVGAQLPGIFKINAEPIILPVTSRGWGKLIALYRWSRAEAANLRSDLVVSLWWHPTHQFIACLLDYRHFIGYFRCKGVGIINNANRIYPLDSNISKTAQEVLETQWFGESQKMLCAALGTHWQNLQPPNVSYALPPDFVNNRFMIVCQPCSFMDNKNWPEANWTAAIASLLQKRNDISVILIGSQKEYGVSGRIMSRLPAHRVWNACGKTSLPELVGLLKSAKVFMGTDSGPAHLAAMLGVNSVVLYGPTLADNYLPCGFRGRTISKQVSCSPCGLRSCPIAGEDKHRCMKSIKPQDVAGAAEDLLCSAPFERSEPQQK